METKLPLKCPDCSCDDIKTWTLMHNGKYLLTVFYCPECNHFDVIPLTASPRKQGASSEIKVTVTKKFAFDFAHKLPGYKGSCGKLHGHRGILEVEVSGPPKNSGEVYATMVLDFNDLKKIIHEKVISKFDHAYLNDFFQYPTAEEMVRYVVKVLKSEFDDNLVRVRFYETPDSYAEWKKE